MPHRCSPLTGFDAATARLARERAQGRCEVCGVNPDTQTHHRLPRRMGGRHRGISAVVNSLSNAIRVCAECHGRIESDRDWALRRGLLLAEGVDPAATPAWLCPIYGQGWWYIHPDTTYERDTDMGDPI